MFKLFLIPNSINENPIPVSTAIAHVRTFFVEEPKSARRLLKGFSFPECRFFDLNEHTKPTQIKEYIQLLKEGDAGVISESGCPCVADPGADLVLLAHQNNIEVVPLVGPSSILLALMGSGLGGQNFAFNGYLPKDDKERVAKIRSLEKRAAQEGQTQVFMETPYRNQKIFDDILNTCQDKTLLCVACDLSSAQQLLKTQPVVAWRKTGLVLPKHPALFIIK